MVHPSPDEHHIVAKIFGKIKDFRIKTQNILMNLKSYESKINTKTTDCIVLYPVCTHHMVTY